MEMGINDQGAMELARALAQNTHLETLALYGNEIGDIGMGFNDDQIGLGKVLLKNVSLTALGLSHNHIQEDGFEVLVEALEQNTTLLLLNMASNQIDSGGVAETADLHDVPEEQLEKFQRLKGLERRLQTNTSLQAFTISDNPLTPEMIARLQR